MSIRDRLRRAITPQATVDDAEWQDVRLAIGGVEARHVRSSACRNFLDGEFRVFSQFGEDGLIQYLLARTEVGPETFVEFGVGDYRESNTRFLLEHDNWRGLILDAGTDHLAFVHSTSIGWRYGLDARHAFITAENIDVLLTDAGVVGDLGLLSVDVDGNDYWILEALTVVSPRILIVEYNSTFGRDRAVSVPYDPAFRRDTAHWSWLYFGASLTAIAHVATKRGYRLVGSNRAGNNAFFVRDDVARDLPGFEPGLAWVESRFQESRSIDGALSYVASHAERRAVIGDMPLVDVLTGEELTVGALGT
jgi:hypothetical protein